MGKAVVQGPVVTFGRPVGGTVEGGSVYEGGGRIGVYDDTYIAGEIASVIRVGVVQLAKATGESWVPGDELFWNTTNDNLTKTSAGGIHAGFAHEAATSAQTVGKVSINW